MCNHFDREKDREKEMKCMKIMKYDDYIHLIGGGRPEMYTIIRFDPNHLNNNRLRANEIIECL